MIATPLARVTFLATAEAHLDFLRAVARRVRSLCSRTQGSRPSPRPRSGRCAGSPSLGCSRPERSVRALSSVSPATRTRAACARTIRATARWAEVPAPLQGENIFRKLLSGMPSPVARRLSRDRDRILQAIRSANWREADRIFSATQRSHPPRSEDHGPCGDSTTPAAGAATADSSADAGKREA